MREFTLAVSRVVAHNMIKKLFHYLKCCSVMPSSMRIHMTSIYGTSCTGRDGLITMFSAESWNHEVGMCLDIIVFSTLKFVNANCMCTECARRALATRVMAVVWRMFALILVSTYTASLASQLIAQRLHIPIIQGFQDLGKQSRISYGCVLKDPVKVFLKVK